MSIEKQAYGQDSVIYNEKSNRLADIKKLLFWLGLSVSFVLFVLYL